MGIDFLAMLPLFRRTITTNMQVSAINFRERMHGYEVVDLPGTDVKLDVDKLCRLRTMRGHVNLMAGVRERPKWQMEESGAASTRGSCSS